MSSLNNDFDVIVIGGGHAGAEAASAAANMLLAEGGAVALVTMDPSRIGQMSCNPAIGGLAKGHMVREVDALGGVMGLAADASGIQFRILNASKGPAVRGPRCQCDKYAYAREVQRLLGTRPNLSILAGTVERLLVDSDRCRGVEILHDDGSIEELLAPSVVLTTGTFMRGLMHSGEEQTPGGRVGEGAAHTISDDLKALGFELGRLKTGTPPRLAAGSLDFDQLEQQPGDDRPTPFSEISGTRGRPEVATLYPTAQKFPLLKQVHCWITHTNEKIHGVIRDNLDRAPMYNGQITEGRVGPRYCPSIEDKVVRFADRTAHHVFLEPESLETDEIYCNGISTSLPPDVQDKVVRWMAGCEQAEILRYGYAVEYDVVWAHQIDATAQTKRLPGLFLAGQINGTTGYEEAAGQGLVAGVNAVLHGRGEPSWRMGRDESYIGVLMDDLVTKVPREPYRMFTSRAEHRLLLRSDNAPERLTPIGRRLGLVDEARFSQYQYRAEAIASLGQLLESERRDGGSMAQWVRQSQVTVEDVRSALADNISARSWPESVLQAVCSELKYAGFIQRHRNQQERMAKMDDHALPTDMDYAAIGGLRNEARAVLDRFAPATFGQASRLAGITPADLTVLAFALQRR